MRKNTCHAGGMGGPVVTTGGSAGGSAGGTSGEAAGRAIGEAAGDGDVSMVEGSWGDVGGDRGGNNDNESCGNGKFGKDRQGAGIGGEDGWGDCNEGVPERGERCRSISPSLSLGSVTSHRCFAALLVRLADGVVSDGCVGAVGGVGGEGDGGGDDCDSSSSCVSDEDGSGRVCPLPTTNAACMHWKQQQHLTVDGARRR